MTSSNPDKHSIKPPPRNRLNTHACSSSGGGDDSETESIHWDIPLHNQEDSEYDNGHESECISHNKAYYSESNGMHKQAATTMPSSANKFNGSKKKKKKKTIIPGTHQERISKLAYITFTCLCLLFVFNVGMVLCALWLSSQIGPNDIQIARVEVKDLHDEGAAKVFVEGMVPTRWYHRLFNVSVMEGTLIKLFVPSAYPCAFSSSASKDAGGDANEKCTPILSLKLPKLEIGRKGGTHVNMVLDLLLNDKLPTIQPLVNYLANTANPEALVRVQVEISTRSFWLPISFKHVLEQMICMDDIVAADGGRAMRNGLQSMFSLASLQFTTGREAGKSKGDGDPLADELSAITHIRYPHKLLPPFLKVHIPLLHLSLHSKMDALQANTAHNRLVTIQILPHRLQRHSNDNDEDASGEEGLGIVWSVGMRDEACIVSVLEKVREGDFSWTLGMAGSSPPGEQKPRESANHATDPNGDEIKPPKEGTLQRWLNTFTLNIPCYELLEMSKKPEKGRKNVKRALFAQNMDIHPVILNEDNKEDKGKDSREEGTGFGAHNGGKDRKMPAIKLGLLQIVNAKGVPAKLYFRLQISYQYILSLLPSSSPPSSSSSSPSSRAGRKREKGKDILHPRLIKGNLPPISMNVAVDSGDLTNASPTVLNLQIKHENGPSNDENGAEDYMQFGLYVGMHDLSAVVKAVHKLRLLSGLVGNDGGGGGTLGNELDEYRSILCSFTDASAINHHPDHSDGSNNPTDAAGAISAQPHTHRTIVARMLSVFDLEWTLVHGGSISFQRGSKYDIWLSDKINAQLHQGKAGEEKEKQSGDSNEPAQEKHTYSANGHAMTRHDVSIKLDTDHSTISLQANVALHPHPPTHHTNNNKDGDSVMYAYWNDAELSLYSNDAGPLDKIELLHVSLAKGHFHVALPRPTAKGEGDRTADAIEAMPPLHPTQRLYAGTLSSIISLTNSNGLIVEGHDALLHTWSHSLLKWADGEGTLAFPSIQLVGKMGGTKIDVQSCLPPLSLLTGPLLMGNVGGDEHASSSSSSFSTGTASTKASPRFDFPKFISDVIKTRVKLAGFNKVNLQLLLELPELGDCNAPPSQSGHSRRDVYRTAAGGGVSINMQIVIPTIDVYNCLYTLSSSTSNNPNANVTAAANSTANKEETRHCLARISLHPTLIQAEWRNGHFCQIRTSLVPAELQRRKRKLYARRAIARNKRPRKDADGRSDGDAGRETDIPKMNRLRAEAQAKQESLINLLPLSLSIVDPAAFIIVGDQLAKGTLKRMKSSLAMPKASMYTSPKIPLLDRFINKMGSLFPMMVPVYSDKERLISRPPVKHFHPSKGVRVVGRFEGKSARRMLGSLELRVPKALLPTPQTLEAIGKSGPLPNTLAFLLSVQWGKTILRIDDGPSHKNTTVDDAKGTEKSASWLKASVTQGHLTFRWDPERVHINPDSFYTTPTPPKIKLSFLAKLGHSNGGGVDSGWVRWLAASMHAYIKSTSNDDPSSPTSAFLFDGEAREYLKWIPRKRLNISLLSKPHTTAEARRRKSKANSDKSSAGSDIYMHTSVKLKSFIQVATLVHSHLQHATVPAVPTSMLSTKIIVKPAPFDHLRSFEIPCFIPHVCPTTTTTANSDGNRHANKNLAGQQPASNPFLKANITLFNTLTPALSLARQSIGILFDKLDMHAHPRWCRFTLMVGRMPMSMAVNGMEIVDFEVLPVRVDQSVWIQYPGHHHHHHQSSQESETSTPPTSTSSSASSQSSSTRKECKLHRLIRRPDIQVIQAHISLPKHFTRIRSLFNPIRFDPTFDLALESVPRTNAHFAPLALSFSTVGRRDATLLSTLASLIVPESPAGLIPHACAKGDDTKSGAPELKLVASSRDEATLQVDNVHIPNPTGFVSLVLDDPVWVGYSMGGLDFARVYIGGGHNIHGADEHEKKPSPALRLLPGLNNVPVIVKLSKRAFGALSLEDYPPNTFISPFSDFIRGLAMGKACTLTATIHLSPTFALTHALSFPEGSPDTGVFDADASFIDWDVHDLAEMLGGVPGVVGGGVTGVSGWLKSWMPRWMQGAARDEDANDYPNDHGPVSAPETKPKPRKSKSKQHHKRSAPTQPTKKGAKQGAKKGAIKERNERRKSASGSVESVDSTDATTADNGWFGGVKRWFGYGKERRTSPTTTSVVDAADSSTTSSISAAENGKDARLADVVDTRAQSEKADEPAAATVEAREETDGGAQMGMFARLKNGISGSVASIYDTGRAYIYPANVAVEDGAINADAHADAEEEEETLPMSFSTSSSSSAMPAAPTLKSRLIDGVWGVKEGTVGAVYGAKQKISGMIWGDKDLGPHDDEGGSQDGGSWIPENSGPRSPSPHERRDRNRVRKDKHAMERLFMTKADLERVLAPNAPRPNKRPQHHHPRKPAFAATALLPTTDDDSPSKWHSREKRMNRLLQKQAKSMPVASLPKFTHYPPYSTSEDCEFDNVDWWVGSRLPNDVWQYEAKLRPVGGNNAGPQKGDHNKPRTHRISTDTLETSSASAPRKKKRRRRRRDGGKKFSKRSFDKAFSSEYGESYDHGGDSADFVLAAGDNHGPVAADEQLQYDQMPSTRSHESTSSSQETYSYSPTSSSSQQPQQQQTDQQEKTSIFKRLQKARTKISSALHTNVRAHMIFKNKFDFVLSFIGMHLTISIPEREGGLYSWKTWTGSMLGGEKRLPSSVPARAQLLLAPSKCVPPDGVVDVHALYTCFQKYSNQPATTIPPHSTADRKSSAIAHTRPLGGLAGVPRIIDQMAYRDGLCIDIQPSLVSVSLSAAARPPGASFDDGRSADDTERKGRYHTKHKKNTQEPFIIDLVFDVRKLDVPTSPFSDPCHESIACLPVREKGDLWELHTRLIYQQSTAYDPSHHLNLYNPNTNGNSYNINNSMPKMPTQRLWERRVINAKASLFIDFKFRVHSLDMKGNASYQSQKAGWALVFLAAPIPPRPPHSAVEKSDYGLVGIANSLAIVFDPVHRTLGVHRHGEPMPVLSKDRSVLPPTFGAVNSRDDDWYRVIVRWCPVEKEIVVGIVGAAKDDAFGAGGVIDGDRVFVSRFPFVLDDILGNDSPNSHTNQKRGRGGRAHRSRRRRHRRSSSYQRKHLPSPYKTHFHLGFTSSNTPQGNITFNHISISAILPSLPHTRLYWSGGVSSRPFEQGHFYLQLIDGCGKQVLHCHLPIHVQLRRISERSNKKKKSVKKRRAFTALKATIPTTLDRPILCTVKQRTTGGPLSITYLPRLPGNYRIWMAFGKGSGRDQQSTHDNTTSSEEEEDRKREDLEWFGVVDGNIYVRNYW